MSTTPESPEQVSFTSKPLRASRLNLLRGPLNVAQKSMHTLLASLKGMFRTIQGKSKRRRTGVALSQPIIVRDPLASFVRQALTVSLALFVVTSVAPSHILETGFTADAFADTDFIDDTSEAPLVMPSFLMNDEGYVLKSSPTVSEEVSRIGMNETVKHVVASGDTLSGIAILYGVRVKTLLWENNLDEKATLKLGQILTIPPVDGVAYTVNAKTETVAQIASTYSVDAKLIRDHNNLKGDVLPQGAKIFIPGGQRKEIAGAPTTKNSVVVRSGVRWDSRSGAAAAASGAQPVSGKRFIFPTKGKITQGFGVRHLALDIANPAKPDIWSIGDEGVITKARTGCPDRNVRRELSCNGGYGNYVVVDYGNKTQVLYAHMQTVYVNVGQKVARGQALGKMGNSGRTYGATGIHTHVELYIDGQKKNLSKYL